MTLSEITAKLSRVSDMYSEIFKIQRDRDWYLLKIQEELGELTSTHLKLTARGRVGDASEESLRTNLEEEVADVLAMTLLYAQEKGIDPELALRRKWFKYL